MRAFLDGLAAAAHGPDVPPKPLRRVHIPKPGKPGADPAARHPHCGRPGGHDGGEDRPRADIRGRLPPGELRVPPEASAHARPRSGPAGGQPGADWVLDADIKACFDEIDHEALMAQVERRVVDRQMLKLLRSWLRAGSSREGWFPTPSREPRRARPSPRCLATSPSTSSTRRGQGGGRRLGTLVRYADDFVVLCPTKERAEEARALPRRLWLRSGCACTPTRPGSSTSQGAGGLRLLGLPSSHGGVLEVAGSLLPSEVAVGPGHGLHQGQGPGADRTESLRRTVELDVVVDRTQPRAAGLGGYFRYGNSSRKFSAHRQLRP